MVGLDPTIATQAAGWTFYEAPAAIVPGDGRVEPGHDGCVQRGAR